MDAPRRRRPTLQLHRPVSNPAPPFPNRSQGSQPRSRTPPKPLRRPTPCPRRHHPPRRTHSWPRSTADPTAVILPRSPRGRQASVRRPHATLRTDAAATPARPAIRGSPLRGRFVNARSCRRHRGRRRGRNRIVLLVRRMRSLRAKLLEVLVAPSESRRQRPAERLQLRVERLRRGTYLLEQALVRRIRSFRLRPRRGAITSPLAVPIRSFAFPRAALLP